MVRAVMTRPDSAVADGAMNVTRLVDIVRSFGLIIVFVTVCLARPRPSLHGGAGTAIAVTLGISVVTWFVLKLSDRWPPLLVPGLIGLAAAGGVLAGLSPNSPAPAIGCMATSAPRSTCAPKRRSASPRRPWPPS